MPETDTKIVLYGYPTSPYVMKVKCFLDYKGLDYQFVGVNPLSPVQIKFSNQRQVPVLTIGEQWRKDSTPLGIWLEECFPERPLLGQSADERERILGMDTWVSEQLIPGRFRAAVEWESLADSLHNGWTLARAVHTATPIPAWVRWLWPFFVRRAGFIRDMVNQLDLTESLADMRARLCREFVDMLGQGPFLGGQQQPSLADLSAYPTIVSPHLMGMRADSPFMREPKVLDWCRRVQAFLPDNPLPIATHLLANSAKAI